MASFNKVILAGNLTRDPELKYLSKGTALCRFSLAINRSYKTDTGETKEEVTFVEVESFGRQAEVIAQYLRKGRALLVEGRLRQDSWEDKQTGQKRTALRVVLEGFSFIDSRGPEANAAGTAPAAPPASRPNAAAAGAAAASTETEPQPPEEGTDDVPF
jgi:single-strand DNA-binding protein